MIMIIVLFQCLRFRTLLCGQWDIKHSTYISMHPLNTYTCTQIHDQQVHTHTAHILSRMHAHLLQIYTLAQVKYYYEAMLPPVQYLLSTLCVILWLTLIHCSSWGRSPAHQRGSLCRNPRHRLRQFRWTERHRILHETWSHHRTWLLVVQCSSQLVSWSLGQTIKKNNNLLLIYAIIYTWLYLSILVISYGKSAPGAHFNVLKAISGAIVDLNFNSVHWTSVKIFGWPAQL